MRISLEIRLQTLQWRLLTLWNNNLNSKRSLLQYTLASKFNEETFLHQFLLLCHALQYFLRPRKM